MRLDPYDFRFEQRHARVEFVERITVQALEAELVSGVSARANPTSRGIIAFHCSAASTGFRLLSTAGGVR